jgi:hypothetical protein
MEIDMVDSILAHWNSLIGPAVVAAIISAIINVIGFFVSTRTAKAIHREKLNFDQSLSERKFDFDKELAERKFTNDRDLHDHKRRVELAESALRAFYEARDVFLAARSRGIFANEGNSRHQENDESKRQQEKRNLYFIPIERLTREKELFARIQSLRYSLVAYFGERAVGPFGVISGIYFDVISAASILIQMTHESDEDDRAFKEQFGPMLNIIGWGKEPRPDAIDLKIEGAVKEIESICRPVLARDDKD